jgi:hypothetical protein
MKEINYVFSVGYRCNSVQFLRRFEVSKFSGPFDWMYIDLETSLMNIHNRFEFYLNDIVILNKNENKLINIKNKNFESINSDILKLYDSNISYMNEDYFKTTLPINQNFTIVNSSNLYEWNRICVFLHNNLMSDDEVNKLKIRIDRLNEVMDKDKSKVMLFHISKIIESKTIDEEINEIYSLVKKYNIESNLVSILCTPNYNDDVKVIDNCFFIIKNVPDYTSQFENNKTDNNFEWLEYGMYGINFEKEYEIIKNNFDLSKILTKEEI